MALYADKQLPHIAVRFSPRPLLLVTPITAKTIWALLIVYLSGSKGDATLMPILNALLASQELPVQQALAAISANHGIAAIVTPPLLRPKLSFLGRISR